MGYMGLYRLSELNTPKASHWWTALLDLLGPTLNVFFFCDLLDLQECPLRLGFTRPARLLNQIDHIDRDSVRLSLLYRL